MIESFEPLLQHFIESAPKIFAAFFAFVALMIAGRFISNSLEKVLGRGNIKAVKQIRLVKRLVRWGFNLLGLVIALNLLGLTQVATSFLAAGGVMAVVLGFAFREIGENLLAGLFLSFSRSFNVGDIIESNGIRGTVKRIEIRDVHIRAEDGSDIFIPSATIYKNPLHNFTRDGLQRGSFTVGIDYKDDPQKARELLLATIQNNENTLKQPAPSVQISGFNPNYVELQVFFWINAFSESVAFSEVRSQLMRACHQALTQNNYTFSSNVTTAIDMQPVDVTLNK